MCDTTWWQCSLQYFSVVCCVSVWSWCVSVTANTSALTCTWLQWVVMELLLLSHALSLSVKNLDRYASYCPTKLAHSRRFSLHILYSISMYIMVCMYAKQVATVLVAEALIAMVCPCCMLLVAFDRFEHWMCPLSNGCSIHAPPLKWPFQFSDVGFHHPSANGFSSHMSLPKMASWLLGYFCIAHVHDQYTGIQTTEQNVKTRMGIARF